jgi:hypothetical protein
MVFSLNNSFSLMCSSLLNSSSGAPLTSFQYFGGFFIFSYWISYFHQWLRKDDAELEIPEMLLMIRR